MQRVSAAPALGGQAHSDVSTAPDGPSAVALACRAYLRDADTGERFPLVAGTVTIGRSAPAELAFADPYLSRRHARIVWRHAAFWFEDLASANGSFINQRPVAGPRRLDPGDVLRLGTTSLAFELASDAASAPRTPHV